MHPFHCWLRLMGMNEKIALCNETSFPNPVPAQVTTNDLALVEATRQGNAEAFAVLVERHTSMIYSLALRLLGGESEAEDATQEAFIRAYYHLNEFRNTAAFATWLYRIALNICRDLLRRRQVREHYTELWRVNHLWADEHYSVDPERVALALENQQLLDIALGQLPASYRATLLLHDVDDLTISEIAALMEIPVSTAKSRLRRARMALVTLLDEYGREEHTPELHGSSPPDCVLPERGETA
jgi:RNA polymerase sigma-70 factor (ECF subfamily)